MCLFFLGTFLFSCKNDSEKRLVASEKDLKKKEIIFSNIDKVWIFNSNPANTIAQEKTLTWIEWRQFLEELKQKPKKLYVVEKDDDLVIFISYPSFDIASGSVIVKAPPEASAII